MPGDLSTSMWVIRDNSTFPQYYSHVWWRIGVSRKLLPGNFCTIAKISGEFAKALKMTFLGFTTTIAWHQVNMCYFSILISLHCIINGPYDIPKWNNRILKNWKNNFFPRVPLWKILRIAKIVYFQCIFKICCSFVIFWDTDIPNMSNWMV